MGKKSIDTRSILAVKDSTEKLAMQIVKDTLESMGHEITEDLSVKLHIKDNSKIKWKPKSHFVKLFTTELNKMYKQGKLNVEKTGFVTILTGCIDFQDNVLRNEDGGYLSQKDIMELTGFGRKKVSNMLNELVTDQVLFEGKQKEDTRKKCYFINPHLFFRGTEISKAVKEYLEKLNIK